MPNNRNSHSKTTTKITTKIITILTDFGSFYPAQMKGVILSKVLDAVLVDIAHDIPAQDIRAGAFALMSSVGYFPRGTVHLAIIDPGVGTDRLGIVVVSGGHLFVGPDNGLLMPAAKSLGKPETYMIDHEFETAPTFHGRDVFAPVVAMLLLGEKPERFGPRIKPIDLDFGEARFAKDQIEAQIIFVDNFGNLILNMRKIPSGQLRLMDRNLKRVNTYAEAERSEPLITRGSHGLAEIAVNQGNAARLFGLSSGDRIVLGRAICLE